MINLKTGCILEDCYVIQLRYLLNEKPYQSCWYQNHSHSIFRFSKISFLKVSNFSKLLKNFTFFSFTYQSLEKLLSITYHFFLLFFFRKLNFLWPFCWRFWSFDFCKILFPFKENPSPNCEVVVKRGRKISIPKRAESSAIKSHFLSIKRKCKLLFYPFSVLFSFSASIK